MRPVQSMAPSSTSHCRANGWCSSHVLFAYISFILQTPALGIGSSLFYICSMPHSPDIERPSAILEHSLTDYVRNIE